MLSLYCDDSLQNFTHTAVDAKDGRGCSERAQILRQHVKEDFDDC